jgi:2-iminobutanoate/2-iminopropanoate deaminase
MLWPKPIITAVLIVLFYAVLMPGGGNRRTIYPPGAKPGGSWSHGILVAGTLYISGMGGEDGAGNIPVEFEAEVRQSLDNIGSVLKKAEMSPSDVVSVQVYLTNAATFERMNKVYMNYFKDPRPTRTTVVVAKLVGMGQIEITATARK